jgi:polar amino acid transport system permease protein
LPAAVFVEFFRNTPVLIQIIWFYFALPILVPFEINAFTASVMGIALNTAAFSADIYRGGIQSIDRGQWDGGRAIGMSYLQTMRRVIIPQAIKRMLPPLTNRGIEVFKMSTLASIVAYAETIHQAKLISESYFNPIESFSVVALLFFVVLFPIVQVTYLLERRFGKSD